MVSTNAVLAEVSSANNTAAWTSGNMATLTKFNTLDANIDTISGAMILNSSYTAARAAYLDALRDLEVFHVNELKVLSSTPSLNGGTSVLGASVGSYLAVYSTFGFPYTNGNSPAVVKLDGIVLGPDVVDGNSCVSLSFFPPILCSAISGTKTAVVIAREVKNA